MDPYSTLQLCVQGLCGWGELNHVRRLFCKKCFVSRVEVPYLCTPGAPRAHPTPEKPSHDSSPRPLCAQSTHAPGTCCPCATLGAPAPSTSHYRDFHLPPRAYEQCALALGCADALQSAPTSCRSPPLCGTATISPYLPAHAAPRSTGIARKQHKANNEL